MNTNRITSSSNSLKPDHSKLTAKTVHVDKTTEPVQGTLLLTQFELDIIHRSCLMFWQISALVLFVVELFVVVVVIVVVVTVPPDDADVSV